MITALTLIIFTPFVCLISNQYLCITLGTWLPFSMKQAFPVVYTSLLPPLPLYKAC